MEWLNTLIERISDLFKWWVVVAPWERAIRVRCGNRVVEFGAGIHIRVPIIDRFYVQSVRLRTIDTQAQTVTTCDGHALTFSGVIQYSITDLMRLYDTLHQPDDTIIDVASAVASQYVSERTRQEISPEGLGAYVTYRMDLGGYGLDGGAFKVVDFAFVRTYRLLSAQRYRNAASAMAMEEYDA